MMSSDKTIMTENLQRDGFLDQEIPKGINLVEEIKRMKKEKNAVILGHYYIEAELQDISDFVGDSLALAQEAARTSADLIVFVGVHFMAETAKIINPSKKVILPDLKAGCSLAESAPIDDFRAFKSKYPDHKVISYINCTADLKTETDIVCTSSNAVKIVNSFPKDAKLIFGPDKNLGNYINSLTGRNMVLWDGACMVHEEFSVEKIVDLMDQHPDAEMIAHPECEKPVLLLAKHIGSTSSLIVVCTNQHRSKVYSGHRERHTAPNEKSMPQQGFYTCTVQRLHLCLQRLLVHETQLDAQTLPVPKKRTARDHPQSRGNRESPQAH
jgi:quinolinate synthase